MCLAIAALVLVGCMLLGMMLSVDRSLLPGLGIGCVLAALTLAGLLRGSQVEIADGVLTYHHGGRANLRLPLTAIHAVRRVDAGLLRGCGLAVERSQVVFLHKSGVTIRQMERLQAQLGVDLILEGLEPDDVRVIAQRVRDAGGPCQDTPGTDPA
jgi:hypothetical protein